MKKAGNQVYAIILFVYSPMNYWYFEVDLPDNQ
jgi:hypothetical protein